MTSEDVVDAEEEEEAEEEAFMAELLLMLLLADVCGLSQDTDGVDDDDDGDDPLAPPPDVDVEDVEDVEDPKGAVDCNEFVIEPPLGKQQIIDDKDPEQENERMGEPAADALELELEVDGPADECS